MKTKKKGMKIARKTDIIVLFTIAGIILLCAILYFGTNLAYSLTEVPDGLSAQETVEQYFEYWDAGNDKGRNLIGSDRFSAKYVLKDGAIVKGDERKEIPWYKSLSLAYLFDDIEITDINKLEIVPDYQYVAQCADYIVFQVDFSKSNSGNDGWDGFAFVAVCKETEDSPWRIDNMFTGW